MKTDGPSKGGMTPKVRALTDALGNPIQFQLMPCIRFDSMGVAPLIEGAELRALLSDKAFDNNDIIAELSCKEGIAQSLFSTWLKESMKAGKRRLAGDTARAANTSEGLDIRREAHALQESRLPASVAFRSPND